MAIAIFPSARMGENGFWIFEVGTFARPASRLFVAVSNGSIL